MKKSHLIALAIFAVTYFLPFRFAVIEVDADGHAASALGILFSGIGILAGIYYLIKDDPEKEGHGQEGSSHH